MIACEWISHDVTDQLGEVLAIVATLVSLIEGSARLALRRAHSRRILSTPHHHLCCSSGVLPVVEAS